MREAMMQSYLAGMSRSKGAVNGSVSWSTIVDDAHARHKEALSSRTVAYTCSPPVAAMAAICDVSAPAGPSPVLTVKSP